MSVRGQHHLPHKSTKRSIIYIPSSTYNLLSFYVMRVFISNREYISIQYQYVMCQYQILIQQARAFGEYRIYADFHCAIPNSACLALQGHWRWRWSLFVCSVGVHRLFDSFVLLLVVVEFGNNHCEIWLGGSVRSL